MRYTGTDRTASSSRVIGEGEMAEKIRGFAWQATPLGRIESWPDTLVTTVNLLLASRHPMFLWWGPELIQFYNDSYRPSLRADKHPQALGQNGVQCWPEIWPIIGPMIEAVMGHGISTFNTNQLVPIYRNGRFEEIFWTYSYSPVRDRDGTVQGTLVVCSETTEQVLSERRLRTLLAINVDSPAQDHLAGPNGLLTFAQAVVGTLDCDPADFPFANLYLLTEGAIVQAGSAVENDALADPSQWPLANLIKSQTPQLVEDLQSRFGDLICKPWPEPVNRAYLLPLCSPGSRVQAVLVLGVSPRLPFDDSYQTFFELAGSRIASLLQSEVHQLERIERTEALERQTAVLAEKAALLDIVHDAIVVQDMQYRILFWNRGAEKLYGWSSQEAIGQNKFELLKAEFSAPFGKIKARMLSHGYTAGEVTYRKRDDTTVTVYGRSVLQRDANGHPVRVLTIDQDITARKKADEQLHLLTERLLLATAVAKVGVWEWELASNTVTWDATMFNIYGLPEVVPMPYEKWSGAVHPEDLPLAEATLRQVIEEKGRGSAQFRIIHSDGSVKHISAVEGVVLDEHANVSGIIGVNIDVTERTKAEEALRKSKEEMTHSAEHDFLTGLPNRMLLYDRIGQAITMAPRHQKKVSVLFLDLDGFKYINDSLGHSIGDKLLQSVAHRLVSCVRDSDTVSRQGGDEFIVLLSEVAPPEDTAVAARRLLKAVAEAHSVDDHKLYVTASIGISVYPEDGVDAETLVKNADTAMYQAKESGRQGFRFFKPEMNIRAVERQSIEEHLRHALERQEFAVYYQPKIDLKTGKIAGAEALLRWTHPTRGAVSPAQFIPVAEDCGLIVPIGRWVLRQACQQAQAWIAEGLPLATMAVNISAMEFRSDNFLEHVFTTLEETGLDPKFLELELTESVLMKQAEVAESILKTLRAAGVRLAVDDFGTGYSSLSYLRKFPVDILKIDQSFVRQIHTVSGGATIVTAIISMGRSLNLRVVAEGVETLEELTFLQAHQCDEVQGYYFSRPVDSGQFAGLLATGIKKLSSYCAARGEKALLIQAAVANSVS
jgi:diguanylate cyclase (GGDEF)-like protein/PAS domain S-box-containing protein